LITLVVCNNENPAYHSPSYYYISGLVYIANGYRLYNVKYDVNKTYYGLFNSASYYSYDSTNQYWYENSSCFNSSTGRENIGSGDNCVSGNLLNYIITSRIDVSLKALTGGKGENCGTSGNDLCIVSRGAGRYVYDETTQCYFYYRPARYWYDQNSYNSSDYDYLLTVGGNRCSIGYFSDRYVRIKVSPDEKTGVLQSNKDIANFAFFAFAGDGRLGEIRFGINDYKVSGMDELVRRIEEEYPSATTPTGEAMYEVYDYLTQNNSHSYESNYTYISRGTERDPFYDDTFNQIIPCKKNSIILISDGEWNWSVDPMRVAYTLHTQDLRSDLEGLQNANIYSLFLFSTSSYGSNSMKSVAAAGGFTDIDGDNLPYNISLTTNSKYISYPRPYCNPNGTYTDNCKEWDGDADGVPDNYFFASDGQQLAESLERIFTGIVKDDYSGGTVGVLGKRSKEYSISGVVLAGTVLGQPLFYSQKYGIRWLGKVYGYWYYLANSTIREDTDTNNILNVAIDKVITFTIENEKDLVINRYNVDGIGTPTTLDAKLYDPDEINYLFEMGYDLWQNYDESNADTDDDRRIYYVTCNQGANCLKEFRFTNVNDFEFEFTYGANNMFAPMLGWDYSLETACSMMNIRDPNQMWQNFVNGINSFDYEQLVNYIRGRDYEGLRTRTIEGKVWKLGDIIYSSPQMVTYPDNRTYIFVGSNDGMLHAFKVGKLEENLSGGNVVELKENDNRKEVWSFIPLNVMPYLRFLADPYYCHLYYVDLTPYVFKTKDDRIILIGGLRFGGATGENSDTAVNPPGWACPSNLWRFTRELCNRCADAGYVSSSLCDIIPNYDVNYSNCLGLSSYFAIDITDPENPVFLWEFTHPDLGFAYSGPVIINKANNTYIMFGSGPTNYKGDVNQPLRYFVIDLDNPNINSPYIINTEITNGFSGRLFKNGFDYNGDGITDYVFAGYGKKETDINHWTGGIMAIDVRDDNPIRWRAQPYLDGEIMAVTAKLETGNCFGRPYLYFGTGRWFHKFDSPYPEVKERIYGIPIICDDTNGCSLVTDFSSNPESVCADASTGVIKGWYRELDLGNQYYQKERDITDPVLTDQNVVLFTTIEPTSDPCNFGGRTRIWALNCATGGGILQNCPTFSINIDQLSGTTLLQLSGGNIEQVSLRDIPGQTSSGETTGWFTGTAPESGPGFVKSIPDKGQILLWLER